MLSKSKHFFSVGPFHESAAKCEQFLNNLQGLALYMETIEQLILLKDKEWNPKKKPL
jgi:hypothetical protein